MKEFPFTIDGNGNLVEQIVADIRRNNNLSALFSLLHFSFIANF